MAVTSRGKRQDAPEAAELAELRAELQVIARVAANVAARCAPGQWTNFQKLLTDQYGVTHADADLFREILAGRRP